VVTDDVDETVDEVTADDWVEKVDEVAAAVGIVSRY